ncbi:MAG: hypothetical protein ACJA2W_000023 [Planctomycetota bacterium]
MNVAAVLFRTAPDLEGIYQRLTQLSGLGEVALLKEYVRVDSPVGVVHVQAFATQWPDQDPESLDELGGQAAGLYPGALMRAGDQNAVWKPGELCVRVHRSFVHLAVVEATGSPVAQTEELERLSMAFLADPEGLCSFFPAGEALRDGNIMGQIRSAAEDQEALPMQNWVNGRLADAGMGTHIADLVGLQQVGQPDAEAVFPADLKDVSPYEVLGFLFDVAHHLAREGGGLEEGVVYEGPGGLRWRAGLNADAQITPARKVTRWIPLSPTGSGAEAPKV